MDGVVDLAAFACQIHGERMAGLRQKRSQAWTQPLPNPQTRAKDTLHDSPRPARKARPLAFVIILIKIAGIIADVILAPIWPCPTPRLTAAAG